MSDFDQLYFVRDAKIFERCLAFIRGNWKAMADSGRCLVVHLMEEASQRSLEQNRLYWRLLSTIADAAWVDGRQFGKDAWHEFYRDKFLPKIEGPGGIYPSSTGRLTVKDFSDYIGLIEDHAATILGIEI